MTTINSGRGMGPIGPMAPSEELGEKGGDSDNYNTVTSPPSRVSSFMQWLTDICLQGWRNLMVIKPVDTDHKVSSLGEKSNSVCIPSYLKTAVCVQSVLGDAEINANSVTCDNNNVIFKTSNQYIVGSNLNEEQLYLGLVEKMRLCQGPASNIVQFSSPQRLECQSNRQNTLLGIIENWSQQDGITFNGSHIADVEYLETESDQMINVKVNLEKPNDFDEELPPIKTELYVTLVGCSFNSEGALSSRDLVSTYKTLKQNVNESEKSYPKNSLQKLDGPTFLSKSGIGRSAALMTLYELMNRHEKHPYSDLNEVQSAVNDIIKSGRRDRSPNFVHNFAQYRAIMEAAALLMEMDESP